MPIINSIKGIKERINQAKSDDLYYYATAIKIALLALWAAQLLAGLVFIIKDKQKNTTLTYVTAFGNGASFFLYITCMCIEDLTRDREKNAIAKIDNIESKSTQLEQKLTKLEKVVNLQQIPNQSADLQT